MELAGNKAEKLIECNELQKSPIPTPNNNLGEVAYRLLWMLTLQDAGLRRFGIGVAALQKKYRAGAALTKTVARIA